MAYDHATRLKVRAKYVQGLPLTAASEAAGVPYNTARTWKKNDEAEGDDWDIARNARRLTKSAAQEMANHVLGELAEQFMATMKQLKADEKMKAADRARLIVQLSDAYSKAMSAAARMLPHEARLAAVMDAIKFLGEAIKQRTPKIHGTFLDLVQQLGPDLMREFGQAKH